MTAKAASAMQYGMHELRTLYNRYASIALICAVLFHLSAIGIYYLLQAMYPGREVILVLQTPHRINFFIPPPSIALPQVQPGFTVSGGGSRAKFGIPVPVPDATVNPADEFSPATDYPAIGEPGRGTPGAGPVTGDPANVGSTVPDVDPLEGYIAVEKDPVLVKMVKPEYPDLARRAQVEGTVYVKVIVGKDGRTRKPQIVKSDADIFNEPAMTAALQCLFTPALMNSGPVAVWVTIPFRFRLNN